MRWTFVVLAILFSLAVDPLAQNAGEQANSSIGGTVVDALTGQPVTGAEVLARNPAGGGRGLVTRPASTTTDAAGRFTFEKMMPGRYVLRASHPGYLNQFGHGARVVSLVPGQQVNDVVVSLTAAGNIAGHITDENARPLSGAHLQALAYSYVEGKREFHEVASAVTDKSGEYRITDLAPGNYYLRARPRDRRIKAGNHAAYGPVYYPNASDKARAVPLEIRPGEQLAGIDISFAPVPTVRISGRVVDARTSVPKKGAQVTLLSDEGDTVFSSEDISTDAKGAFEITGVPLGSYVLVAQSSDNKSGGATLWGRTSVEVGDDNIGEVKLAIGPGVEVSGRIRAEGKPSVDLGKITAALDPQEPPAVVNRMPEIDSSQLTADGKFVFHDVPEGSYRLNFSSLPPGFYLKTDGAQAAPQSGITVGRGHAPAPLEMVLSPASAYIQGAVSDGDQPAAGARVVLVPDATRRHQLFDYRTAVSDKSGRFMLRDVAPGDYMLFAWEEIERGAYLDPDFLREYEDQGQAVHVEEGKQTNVQLQEIPASGTVQ